MPMYFHRPAVVLTLLLAFTFAGSLRGAQRTASKKGSSTQAEKSGTTAVPKKPASTSKPKPAANKPAADKPIEAKPVAKPSEKPAEKETSKPAEKLDSTPIPDTNKPEPSVKVRAPSASIETSDLVEYATLPPRTQRVIEASLALTKLNLTYTYGSADPARGGMDCSGTIYYTLRSQGFPDVPRDSPGQYVWVRKAGGFQAVNSRSAESFEFDDLKPGDLLFWSGTYAVEREIPITHVMLYLGREKKSGARVMFGASDGRSYKGVQRWGVSVFDFKMPKAADPSRSTNPVFLGYGPIPGIHSAESAVAAAPVEEKVKEVPEDSKAPEVAKKPAPKTTKPVTKPSTKKAPAKRKK